MDKKELEKEIIASSFDKFNESYNYSLCEKDEMLIFMNYLVLQELKEIKKLLKNE